jgi:uroporphyrinogen decarboxylase
MTSRERIQASLMHREADRVPVDLGGTESSGISGIAYNRLKKHLGIKQGKTQIFDIMQQISKVEKEALEKVGADAAPLLIEPREWKKWKIPDGSSCKIPRSVEIKKLENGDELVVAEGGTPLMIRPKGSYYFDSVYHPLQDAKNEDDIDRGKRFFESTDMPWYNDEGFDNMRIRAKKIYEEDSRTVIGNLWVHLFAAGQDIRGYENFMVDLIINKRIAHRILTNQLKAYLPRIDDYLDAVVQYVDIIQVNDDLGSQSGPLLKPELYREMIKPYHKELWGYIKKKSKKPLLLHSCGSVYELIPDIIECGIDAINPVQVSAAHMDTKKLKREFGRDLVFWGGGCDTQWVLPHGKPEEIRDEVKRRVDDLAPGGGFVFCQVHNIQPDVPPENILAMYEALGSIS